MTLEHSLLRLVVVLSAVVASITASSASADTFGSGANQFTLDFVPISGATNPTPVQATAGDLDGFGIVEYDYRMGVYEITHAQWSKFVAQAGPPTGNQSDAYRLDFYDHGTGTSHLPTNNVSWYEAAQFVNWLNTSTGHHAAYKFTGTQGTSDYTFAAWDASEAWGGTNLYRHQDTFYFLPDEDEWFKAAYWNGTSIQEYATKPGDTLHQGDGLSGTGWNYPDSDDGGWAADPEGPWDVGSGSEELNGTEDMMGNVWEWVESPWSNSNYSARSSRGVRGGSCLYYSYGMKASYRYGYLVGISPILELYHLGFRVASILEPVIGDLNDDGIVGSRDLDLVRGWWLMEVEPGRLDRGDATGDGIVDSADLDIVRGNWGAGLAAVPEPTVGSLFACGFLTWTATRRRRRRRAKVAGAAEFSRR